MKPSLFLSLLFFTAIPGARGFEEALAPAAMEHRAKILKLAEKRDSAMVLPRDTYLAVLEAEGKTAKAEKAKKAVSAIKDEIAAVKDGRLDSKDRLPKPVLTARNTYERLLKEAEFEIEKELKKLNAAYLGELNRIPLGQMKNEKLAREIESEKKAMETGIVGPVINLETEIVGTKWRVFGKPEDIWTFDREGRLKGKWSTTFPAPDLIVIRWNDKASLRLTLSKDGRALLASGKPKVTLASDLME